jgi:hypothetical protein
MKFNEEKIKYFGRNNFFLKKMINILLLCIFEKKINFYNNNKFKE